MALSDLFQDPDELFGSSRPEGLKPFDRDDLKRGKGMSKEQFLEGGTKGKPTDHKGRARRYFEKQGYIFCPSEYRDTHYGGVEVGTILGKKHDLFGLFDAVALSRSGAKGIIGIQICSTNDARNHIRKMCSAEVDTKCGTARVVSLRAWLTAGNSALVLEFQRRAPVGTQIWFPVEHWITEEVIADVERRRRK